MAKKHLSYGKDQLYTAKMEENSLLINIVLERQCTEPASLYPCDSSSQSLYDRFSHSQPTSRRLEKFYAKFSLSLRPLNRVLVKALVIDWDVREAFGVDGLAQFRVQPAKVARSCHKSDDNISSQSGYFNLSLRSTVQPSV